MKILLATGAATALLALTGCGTQTGDTASDPDATEPTPTSSTSPSDRIPSADGLVSTRNLVTVMDTGGDTGSPELCLGAVAESYPPQCSGPPIAGWSWKDQEGVFERSGDVRWGLFSLTGSWDGETFTVESAIPGALYDPAAPVDEPTPTGDGGPAGYDEKSILEDLEADPLPGTLTVSPAAGGIVVDVVYDDGSIQAEATERYGSAVTVTSALVPIQR